ncbi:MAG: thioredoxin-like domain-containing protein [Pirellula sp.]
MNRPKDADPYGLSRLPSSLASLEQMSMYRTIRFLSSIRILLCSQALLPFTPLIACGQEPTSPKAAPNSNTPPASVDQSLPATDTDWPALQLPNDAPLSQSLQFVQQAKSLRPKTPQQAFEQQRWIAQASARILEQLDAPEGDVADQARSDYFSASAVLLPSLAELDRLRRVEEFKFYVATKPILSQRDLETVFKTGLALEALEDKTLASKTYAELADLLREKDATNYAPFAEVLKQNAARLQVGKSYAFQSRTMEGSPFRLESLKGKVVLLYFWSSRDQALQQEVAALQALHDQYREQGFEVIGIGLDESLKDARATLATLKPRWPNLWDDRKQGVLKVMENYGINAIPTWILLDRELRSISHEANAQSLRGTLIKLFPSAAQPATEEPPKDEPSVPKKP